MTSACMTLLEDMEQWAKQSTGFDSYYIYVRGVRVRLATAQGGNQSDTVISYFYGKLNYVEKNRVFTGDLKQLFSDRYQGNTQPFNINKADTLNLEIFIDGRVQFTLKSWKNYSGSFIAACQRGLLQGFDKDNGYWTMNFDKLSIAL